MSLRIVVALHSESIDLERLLRLDQHAEALGATLCAWGAFGPAFSLAGEDVEEALALATTAAHEAPHFAVAIAVGELSAVRGASSMAELSWGPPLVAAQALAAGIAPGVVCVHESAASSFGPWTTDTILEVQSAHGLLHEGRVVELDPDATAAFPDRPSTGLSEMPPPPQARADAELALVALRAGDLAAFDMHLASLKEQGASSALISRLTGLAALGRGATDDALRTLRVAADSSRGEVAGARARLAYAVGLASVGRVEEALLACLGALAAARRSADRPGELACSRFLARLSMAAGAPDASRMWEQAAEQARPVA